METLLSPSVEAFEPLAHLALGLQEAQERAGTYTISSPGWAAYKGIVTKATSHAAISALTLLAFLFFLNLLQQQLSSGQQQTLLFMVNNTAPINREGRKLRARRLLNFGGTLQREMQKRDLRVYRKHARNQHQNELGGTNDLPAKYTLLDPPHPLAAPPTVESTNPPVMMEGLQSGSTLQLMAWLKGKMSANELRVDLVDTLTNCRAVVACTLYQSARDKDSEKRVRKLLIEAGEYAEPGHLDEACNTLLLSAGDDCDTLAQAFSTLLN